MVTLRHLPLILLALAGPATASPPAVECVGLRYIGVVSDPGSCKNTLHQWSRARLFPGATEPELAGYCTYTWQGSGPPNLATLPKLGANSPTLDCAAVTGHGPSVFEASDQAVLEASFREQVEALDTLPATAAGFVPTRVVIVDSSMSTAFPDPSTGLIDHGRVMGLIVRELACGNGRPASCRAVVANRLALPLVRTANDTLVAQASGGRFGSLGNVATAIMEGYNLASATQPAGPVVLNLSVGWDPGLGGAYSGDDPTTLPPPIRAVNSAVTFAACRGALLIAATGNASNGPDEVPGGAYPAAWEAKPTPSLSRCSDLGGLASGPTPTTGYRRLIYGVGGVDPRDRPLENARPGSLPSLVAPASHATISHGGSNPTRVLTGSSVATAVVTAAASTMWSYLPTLSRHDIIDRLRYSAVDLGLTPALQPESCGGACPASVRRVSFCQAVANACNNGGSCAPNSVSCPIPSVPRDARPEGLDFTATTTHEVVQPPYLAGQAPSSPCTRDFFASSPAAPLQCPADEVPNSYAKPFSGPQPGKALCPTCPLLADYTIFIDINPDIIGDIKEPTVIAFFPDGTTKAYALDVDPAELFPGAMVKVFDMPVGSGDVVAANIEFKVTANGDEYSSSDPLILEK